MKRNAAYILLVISALSFLAAVRSGLNYTPRSTYHETPVLVLCPVTSVHVYATPAAPEHCERIPR